MSTTTKVKMPKAAAELIADIERLNADSNMHGEFEVKVTHDSIGVEVWVSYKADGVEYANGHATWSETVVYDTPMSSERLGFRTHGGKTAVRFAYASGWTKSRGHEVVRSVRHLRLLVGLPEKAGQW